MVIISLKYLRKCLKILFKDQNRLAIEFKIDLFPIWQQLWMSTELNLTCFYRDHRLERIKVVILFISMIEICGNKNKHKRPHLLWFLKTKKPWILKSLNFCWYFKDFSLKRFLNRRKKMTSSWSLDTRFKKTEIERFPVDNRTKTEDNEYWKHLQVSFELHYHLLSLPKHPSN